MVALAELLPADLVLYIAAFVGDPAFRLGNVQDLATPRYGHLSIFVVRILRRVCKSWWTVFQEARIWQTWDARLPLARGHRSMFTDAGLARAPPFVTRGIRYLHLSDAHDLGDGLQRFCLSTPGLQELHVSSCTFRPQPGLCAVVASCVGTHLRALHCTALPQLTAAALQQMAARAPHVTELLLDSCGALRDILGTDADGSVLLAAQAQVHTPPPLLLQAAQGEGDRRREVLSVPLRGSELVAVLCPWLPTLTSLSLINQQEVQDEDVHAMLQHCTALKKLDLSRCRMLGHTRTGGRGLLSALCGTSSAQVGLGLSSRPSLAPGMYDLQPLPPSFQHQLTHLHLSAYGSSTRSRSQCESDAVDSFSHASFPRLESLDLSWCPWMSDRVCKAVARGVLASTAKLTALTLHACTALSGEVIQDHLKPALHKSSLCLSRLDLGQLGGLQDRHIAALLSSPLSSLTHLTLSGCPHVGPLTYAAMGQHCPMLQEVGSRLSVSVEGAAVWAWLSAAQERVGRMKREALERRARINSMNEQKEEEERRGSVPQQQAVQWPPTPMPLPSPPATATATSHVQQGEGVSAAGKDDESHLQQGEGVSAVGKDDESGQDSEEEEGEERGVPALPHGRAAAGSILDGHASIAGTSSETGTAPMRYTGRPHGHDAEGEGEGGLPAYFGAPTAPPPEEELRRLLLSAFPATPGDGEDTGTPAVPSRAAQQQGAGAGGGRRGTGGGVPRRAGAGDTRWPEATASSLGPLVDTAITLPLRQIDWWRSLEIGDDACRAVSSYAPRLRAICLDGCEVSLGDTGVVALLAACHGIQHLSLSGCPLTDASLKALSRSPCAPGLTYLDLSGGLEYTRHGLEGVFRACRALQTVRLKRCTGVCDGSVRTLLAHCKYLRTLDISVCGSSEVGAGLGGDVLGMGIGGGVGEGGGGTLQGWAALEEGLGTTPEEPAQLNSYGIRAAAKGDLLTSSILEDLGRATLPYSHPLRLRGYLARPPLVSPTAALLKGAAEADEVEGGGSGADRLSVLNISRSFAMRDYRRFLTTYALDPASSLHTLALAEGCTGAQLEGLEMVVKDELLRRRAHPGQVPPSLPYMHILNTARARWLGQTVRAGGHNTEAGQRAYRHRALLRMEYAVPGLRMAWRLAAPTPL